MLSGKDAPNKLLDSIFSRDGGDILVVNQRPSDGCNGFCLFRRRRCDMAFVDEEASRELMPQSDENCGTGARIKISPFGFGITGFLFIGGFSGGVKAGGEVQVELGSSPGASGCAGPRVGYGGYAAGGLKRTATAATPELCY